MATDTTVMDGVICLHEAMGNMDGDAELLQEIVGMFMDSGDDQLSAIADFIAAGATKDVAINAHGMKGGASNFCARKFVASALELEMLAKNGSLVGAPALLEAMRENFAELQEVVPAVNWQELARTWKR